MFDPFTAIIVGFIAHSVLSNETPKKKSTNIGEKVPYVGTIALGCFEGVEDKDLSYKAFSGLMDFLIEINQLELRDYDIPQTLEESNIRYKQIVNRRDLPWADLLVMNWTGEANCKSLCAAEIAMLRQRGVIADYELTQVINDDGTQNWHVRVKKIVNGAWVIDDVSKRFGMVSSN